MVVIRYKETQLSKPADEYDLSPLRLSVPLPDLSARDNEQLETALKVSDAEDKYYLEHVATHGSMLCRHTKSGPKNIVWRVLERNRLLELQPVDFAGKLYRKVQIKSPLFLRAGCVQVHSDHADEKIIIDWITVNGFFYTVSFPYEAFEPSKSAAELELTSKHAQSWRSIKSPYSFDIKKPMMLRAVSPRTSVVSLVDGTLLRLDRNSPLGVITTSTFHDSARSGLLFSRLIPWNYSEKVPGHHDVSVKAVVSMDVKGSVLATLSVDLTLKLWNLETSALVAEKGIYLSGYYSHSNSTNNDGKRSGMFLEPVPARLLSFSSGSESDRLITFCPLGDGVFQLWEATPHKLESLGDSFEIPAVQPESTAVWVIADLKLHAKHKDHHQEELWVTWKSDTSSAVHMLTIPSKAPLDRAGWVICEKGLQSDLQQELTGPTNATSDDESSYYVNRIFGPGGFSLKTIQTALPIYGKHYASGVSQLSLEQLERLSRPQFIERVCKTVGAAVSMVTSGDGMSCDYKAYGRDLQLQWVRFTRLCSELEKQGQEVLSFVVDADQRVYLIKSSFISVVRECTEVELYSSNRSTAPSAKATQIVAELTNKDPSVVDKMLRLLDAMASFRNGLSKHILREFFVVLEEDFSKSRHNFLTSDRLVNIYESHIAPQLSETSLGVLVTAMFEIEELDSVVGELYGAIVKANRSEGHTLLHSALGAQYLTNSLFEVSSTCQALVIDVLIIMVISSSHDDLIQEETTGYSKFSRLLKQLCMTLFLLSAPCKTGYTTDYDELVTGVHDLTVAKSHSGHEPLTGLSFMDSLILSSNDQGGISFELLWTQLLMETAPSKLSVELFRFAPQAAVEEFLAVYIPSDYLSTFIKGAVLLAYGEDHKARALLNRVAVAVGIEADDMLDRNLGNAIAERIDSTLRDSLSNGIISFYLSLSKFAEKNKRYSCALSLAKLAMNYITTQPDKAVDVNMRLFDCAIECRSYDDAYQALVELQIMEESPKYEAKTDILVESMVSHGYSRRMCSYPFIGMRHEVAKCLEALRKYETLYSWHMEKGDVKGAATAAYLQLAKNNIQGDVVGTRDMYELVLNTLKGIGDEQDRWIVVEATVNPRLSIDGSLGQVKRTCDIDNRNGYRTARKALHYDDIQEEYHQFVSSVEGLLKKIVG
ncbi:hypothetical protein TRVA0_015S01354 [Trichomonascus vanleenenianus]|uniref:uncharacterized protein n=1 Tax=Trichomonascus vanleenenianus TaxID=2268995 RepID=UPI003ECB3DA9